MSKQLDREIKRRRWLLQNQYAFLDGEGSYQAEVTNSAVTRKSARQVLQNPWAFLNGDGLIDCSDSLDEGLSYPKVKVNQLLGSKRQGDRFLRSDIEVVVRNLQNHLWQHRSKIWADGEVQDPTDVLDPKVALGCIGYSVSSEDSLGQYFDYDGAYEVAGLVDKAASLVRISKQLPYQTRSFTTAHELGHAILHTNIQMHRDRAVDGSDMRSRDPKESEADVFASLFLLPQKPVRLAFQQRFRTQSFSLSEVTAFALNAGSLSALKSKCRTLRGLSRLIAGGTSYNGRNFYSLSDHFGVSVETMAIRLEELQLIQGP